MSLPNTSGANTADEAVRLARASAPHPLRIEVEVERLSPAAMLLRAVGKLLDRPSNSNAESIAQAD